MLILKSLYYFFIIRNIFTFVSASFPYFTDAKIIKNLLTIRNNAGKKSELNPLRRSSFKSYYLIFYPVFSNKVIRLNRILNFDNYEGNKV